MNPIRGVGCAAVAASAVCAGIIASSRGSPIDTPRPWRTVRRERCLRVMNIGHRVSWLALLWRAGLRGQRLCDGRGDARLLKCVTRDDPHDDGGELVTVAGIRCSAGVTNDGSDRRHVVI